MVWGRLIIAFWVPRLTLDIRATLGHGTSIMSDYRRIVKGRPQTVRLRSGNDDFLDGNLSQHSYDQRPIGKLVTISKAKLHVSGEMILDIGVGHLPRGADTPKRTSCRWTRRLADTSPHERWRSAAHVMPSISLNLDACQSAKMVTLHP